MPKNINQDQIAIMVEFMEKNGDISYQINSPHGRVRRRALWQELKKLLENCGNGPYKSVEQWVKTWSDLKHRVKRKILYNRVNKVQSSDLTKKLNDIELRVGAIMGIRKKKPIAEVSEAPLEVPLEIHAASSSEVYASRPSLEVHASPSEVYASLSSEGYANPSADIAPETEPVPSEVTLQTEPQRIIWLQQQIPTVPESLEKSHECFTKMFVESENRRLKSEEDRSRKQYDIEERRLALEERRQALEERWLAFEERQEEHAERLQDYEKSRLQLEILRENNLHEREAVRAQIDRDTINIQQELFHLIKQALNKYPDK